VIGAVSGGVDSTVAATLMHEVRGKKDVRVSFRVRVRARGFANLPPSR
jgi:tRNA(Ile)-lysidine synthase TilS/MesJ